jgi:hypothetical protein
MTATARRGHGEGSIYRDAANGTWVGAISLGWRPNGTRIRRKVTGRTKTDVREKLKRLRAEADAGLKTSASYTLAKAVDDWAAEALEGLAAKTVRSHVDLLRRWPPASVMSGAALRKGSFLSTPSKRDQLLRRCRVLGCGSALMQVGDVFACP